MSGAAFTIDQRTQSADTAIEGCARGGTAASPLRVRTQFAQPQFHCGSPPPAAEPSTRTRIEGFAEAGRVIARRYPLTSRAGRADPAEMGWSLRTGVAAATLAIAVAIAGCQGACSSAKLAPVPSESERARIAALSLPYAVRVEPGDFPPIYAERLADALRAANVFAKVALAGRDGSDAPLVARVSAPSEGAAVLPLFTALTLGLFPTWAEETWGLGFVLEAPGAIAPPVAIDFRWRGTSFLGWVSALLNLAPGRGPTPDEGPRYAEHVAASIAPHASAIEALVASAQRPPK